MDPLTKQNITCGGKGSCNLQGDCECAEGYRGKTCNLRCPVNPLTNPPAVCYGSGSCDNEAKCHCFRGYMGEMCNVGCQRCPVSNKLCCFGRCHYDGRCLCRTIVGVRYVGTTCELKWHEQETDKKMEEFRKEVREKEEREALIAVCDEKEGPAKYEEGEKGGAKESAKKDATKDADAKKKEEKPDDFKKWVYMIWAARLLDGIGGGFFYWAQTIGFHKWGMSIGAQSTVITGISIVGLLALPIAMKTSKKTGLAWVFVI